MGLSLPRSTLCLYHLRFDLLFVVCCLTGALQLVLVVRCGAHVWMLISDQPWLVFYICPHVCAEREGAAGSAAGASIP